MKFCMRYYHNGYWYGGYIYADTFEDAQEICSKHSLQLDGLFITEFNNNWFGRFRIRFLRLEIYLRDLFS